METEAGAWDHRDFVFLSPGRHFPLNPYPLLLRSELGSDFIPQVSKETMPAVAASAASCPLAAPGHFPGLFCSAWTGDGCWLSPGTGERTSLTCLSPGGISLSGRARLGHGMTAGKGYAVSLGFLLPPFPSLCWQLPSCGPHQQQRWAAPDRGAGARFPSQPKPFG